MPKLHFSIIVPIYNRPDEIEKVLNSLTGKNILSIVTPIWKGRKEKQEELCK